MENKDSEALISSLEDTANEQLKSEQKIVESVVFDVIKESMASINCKINKLNRNELEAMLRQLHLRTRGTNDVLRKRLKTFYKEQKALKKKYFHENHCPYKYLCVIDFEATCDEKSNIKSSYIHEIIEFPAVLIETSSKSVISEFHEYCHPVINNTLTEFCTSLTGITQDIVDQADLFPKVLQRFIKWMDNYKLGKDNSYAIVTDGPWDMNKFLVMQCDLSHTPFPDFGKKWINIKKTFSKHYKTKKYSLNSMLELLGMEFEGKMHCGLDDARNIAKIAIHLLEDRATVVVNERILWNNLFAKVMSESGGFGEETINKTNCLSEEEECDFLNKS